MTHIGDYWTGLWDTIYAVVDGLDIFDEVNQGLKLDPDQWPAAFVDAGKMSYNMADTGGTYYEWEIPIFIIDVKDNVITGKKSVIDLAEQVQEALVADRWLGLDWTDALESVVLDSSPRDAPTGFEQQTVKVTVIVRAFLDGL